MTAPRLLMSIALALAAAGASRAQSVDLIEAPLAGRCCRIELALELKGKITVQQQGETVSFPHEAQARHVYVERVMHVADGADGAIDKTARHYQKAEATITFNKQTSRRTLRAERASMVAQRSKDELLVYSPRGSLSREEKELTEHFDTLAVPGLVPNKAVKVGESWRLATPAVMALCDLVGLTDHDLTCKLEHIKGDVATVSIAGTVSGIAQGAQVKLLVDAHYEFDRKDQRVVAVLWRQSEQRQQGPISPAMSADVSIELKRTPIAEPVELNEVALVPAQAEPAADVLNLHYRDGKGRYELQHDRAWHVVSPESSAQLVLRLMDRGDFIAQATISPWKHADPKAVVSLEQFYELMKTTPGWQEEEILEKTELKQPRGHARYRVTASGILNEAKAVQSFYLVVSPEGEQLIVSFAIVPAQVQKLGARDLELVRGIGFAK
jgi:hypothetical protein